MFLLFIGSILEELKQLGIKTISGEHSCPHVLPRVYWSPYPAFLHIFRFASFFFLFSIRPLQFQALIGWISLVLLLGSLGSHWSEWMYSPNLSWCQACTRFYSTLYKVWVYSSWWAVHLHRSPTGPTKVYSTSHDENAVAHSILLGSKNIPCAFAFEFKISIANITNISNITFWFRYTKNLHY